MKLLKQIVLILAVVYNQSIGAMEEAIPKVPMPPALKPTLPVRIPRKKKSQPPHLNQCLRRIVD